MEAPFSAYRGNGPYVFVCYAHEDEADVYPDIQWLHERGVNIWYDEGVAPGENWRAVTADALLRASDVLYYVSTAAVRSDHCNREINLAFDEGLNVVPVFLEDVALTPDLRIGLGRIHRLVRDEGNTFKSQLLRAFETEVAGEVPPNPVHDDEWSKSNSVLLLVQAESVDNVGDPTEVADELAEAIHRAFQARGLFPTVAGGRAASKNVPLEPLEEGRKHGASHVLTCSLRYREKGVRLAVQLSDATTGVTLSNDRIDNEEIDIRESVDLLATDIATDAVSILSVDEWQRHSDLALETLSARATAVAILAGAADSFDRVFSLLRRALQKEPRSVLLHELFARCMAGYLGSRPKKVRLGPHKAEALFHADAAVGLAPRNSAVLAIASEIYGLCDNVEVSLQLAQRALHLSNNRYTQHAVATALLRNGRFSDAVPYTEVNRSNDERFLSGVNPTFIVLATTLGRFEEALKESDRLLARAPASWILWGYRANVLAMLGRDTEAESALAKSIELAPNAHETPKSQAWLEAVAQSFRTVWRREECVDALTAGLKRLSA